jgi:hypothetical protein
VDDHGLGFQIPAGIKDFFVFSVESRPAVCPSKSHIKWTPGAVSRGVTRPDLVTDHSSSSSSEIKNAEAIYLPSHAFSLLDSASRISVHG